MLFLWLRILTSQEDNIVVCESATQEFDLSIYTNWCEKCKKSGKLSKEGRYSSVLRKVGL